jgi:hypothetical protein
MALHRPRRYRRTEQASKLDREDHRTRLLEVPTANFPRGKQPATSIPQTENRGEEDRPERRSGIKLCFK